uniref:Ig-like domain-containing protein n=1 Tax=Romanomermis culicivorax TaxID=13658 RepID=A0A915HHZ0_ROMCU
MVLINSKIFLTEPKLDSYLVKPGDKNIILPCSISDDYIKTSGTSLQWLRINTAGPRLITLGSTTKVNSGYELDTVNCSSKSSNDAQQQIGCYNLRIKHVSYEQDNGNFFCQVDKSDGSLEQSNPAKVIVIGQLSLEKQYKEKIK